MSDHLAGISLHRFVDELPSGTSDEDASVFLSQKMHEHGFKVYVRKPARASVFRNGFPSPLQQYTDVLSSLHLPIGRAKKEIIKAKTRGPVINYGIEEPGITFLQLDSIHVDEIAAKKLTQVHWFTGDALCVEQHGAATVTSGLTTASPCLRCVRPSNDWNEMTERQRLGGALTHEPEFSYEFRIHDVFVNATDLGLLQFETYKPNKRGDPFGIHDSSFAVYLAYRAAKHFHRSLLNRTRTNKHVIIWLNERSTKSPYSIKYVANQIFKYINPLHHRGIGASAPPFNVAALRSFREQYPAEDAISDGLALIISASIWWSEGSDRHARGERPNLPPTGELRKKLKYYGFSYDEEMDAIVKVVLWTRSNAKAKPKAKTKSEKKPKMRLKPKPKDGAK